MKKFISSILFLLIVMNSRSQQLGQITFSWDATISSFTFITDQDVLIRISPDGKVLEWGIEIQSLRNANYYAPSLQPFMGRVEYYGVEGDSVSMGKIKSIGTTLLTYYGPYETIEKKGKLRSVGTVILDYFTNYENKDLRGKLRFAGNLVLEYYSSFDEEAFRGKLKAVGNTQIAYYSIFDDRLNKGKIKSIGPVKYTWYSSFERSEFRGSLKSGNYRANINGVTYIIH